MKRTFKKQITLGDMILFALTLVLIAISLSSCETPQDVESDLGKLKQDRTILESKVNSLRNQADHLNHHIIVLKEKEHQLSRETSGTPVHYILKLKLKQSHFSLDMGDHIKDAMNAIEFEMAVDKELYNSVRVGTEIVDEFRSGSFWIKGKLGRWKMTVEEKRIL